MQEISGLNLTEHGVFIFYVCSYTRYHGKFHDCKDSEALVTVSLKTFDHDNLFFSLARKVNGFLP